MDGFGVKNGGELTASEAMHFDHQLKHANLLYLGCKVLVLLDLSYQSRFWTQFELWLSVQEGTDEGLKPATEVHAQRWHLEPIHNATRAIEEEVLNIWRTKTPEEAHKLLEGADVHVTNQRDKTHHLPKILSLDEDVRLDVRKSALEMRAASFATFGFIKLWAHRLLSHRHRTKVQPAIAANS